MLIRQFALWACLAGIMVVGADVVFGQNFPNKPIRVVAGEAGGSSDFAVRQITSALSANLNQRVIVDNRGGSGAVPAEILAKAPPDGYTLLFSGSSLWISPFLENVSYDPIRDFSSITTAVSSPNIIVVHPSVAANSVKELIALAKAKPGALNYAASSAGGSSHLAAELFMSMAGIKMVHVPYRGSAPALSDVIAGNVQLMFATATAATPHVKSGKLRALGVTTLQPSALLPGLPTAASTGLPGYESASIWGVFAPAKTPVTLVNQLNREFVRALNSAEVKERLLNVGVEVVGNSPEQSAAAIKSEMARLGKVIKDLGIRVNY